VKCDLKVVPQKTLLSDYLQAGAYQAALLDLNLSPYPDPDPYPFWSQTQFPSGQNYAQFDDRSISETLELARTSTLITDRIKLYRNFQYRFNYVHPALILWHPTYTYAVDSRLLGISVGPLYDDSDRLAGIRQWYINVLK
jgi:peptide/nickel transport system substrate-binding protein